MGKFKFSRVQSLLDNTYKIAVETGTFKGEGTRILNYYFDKVYTIEIDEELYKKVLKKRFLKFNNKVKCILGNSAEVLLKIKDELNNDNGNILFWLDAHWSGDNKVDWENSSWKGYIEGNKVVKTGYINYDNDNNNNTPPNSYQQVPLEEEIMNIYENINKECVLYIDDFNKIDPITLKGLKNKSFKNEDWSHLDFNIILEKIKDRIIYKNITNKQCIIKLRQKN